MNLVEAGEHAGALETLLDKVATYKEKTEALKKKIKKALFYPAAVLAVAVIVTIILLIFVIPQFESLFKGFGADLPAFTQMVINLSRFVQDAGLVDGHRRRRRRLRVLLLQEALAPDAPRARSHAAEGAGRRPDHGEGGDRALCAHAVDDVRGRRAAGRSADLGRWRDRQHRLRRSDAAGFATKSRPASACSARMEETGLFPNMVIQMIAVGEESGSLDSMAAKVADFYEADVDAAVDAMSSLLEPLIMAILGVLVGGLVIAMYLPIFKLGAVV